MILVLCSWEAFFYLFFNWVGHPFKFLQNLLFCVPFRYEVTNEISMLIILQVNPAASDCFWFLMLTPDCTMALGMMPSRFIRRKKSGLQHSKTTASLRAPTQWAAKKREHPPSSSADWWNRFIPTQLFRRPSEWLHTRLVVVNLDSSRQLMSTSPKEKLHLLHVFLWHIKAWFEHCFFTMALHMHILVNIFSCYIFPHFSTKK